MAFLRQRSVLVAGAVLLVVGSLVFFRPNPVQQASTVSVPTTEASASDQAVEGPLSNVAADTTAPEPDDFGVASGAAEVAAETAAAETLAADTMAADTAAPAPPVAAAAPIAPAETEAASEVSGEASARVASPPPVAADTPATTISAAAAPTPAARRSLRPEPAHRNPSRR